MLGKTTGRVTLVAAIFFCLVGLYFSWQLNLIDLKGKSAAAKFVTYGCTARENFNCDAAANSKWGKIVLWDWDLKDTPRRLSTSLLGSIYFGLLLSWYVFVGRPNYRGRFWHLLPMLLNTAGVLIAAWFTYIMFTQLSTLCPWCLVAHGANLGVFVCTLLLWPRRPAVLLSPFGDAGEYGDARGTRRHPVRESAFPSFRHAGAALGLAFAFAAVQFFYSADREMAAKFLNIKTQYTMIMEDERVVEALKKDQKRFAIPWREDDPVLGDRGAPETLTVFSDFECPTCGEFHKRIPNLMKSFEGRLRIIFKHNPLCTDCSPSHKYNVHPHACKAAYAAEAVRMLGGNDAFWKMADLLFENQTALGRIDLARLAERVGVSADAFRKVVNGEAVKQRVAEDIALAKEADTLGSTPGLYRNDVHFTNWYGPTSTPEWKRWRVEAKQRAMRVAATQTAATTKPASRTEPNSHAASTANITIRPDDFVRGPADAADTLVVFYSLQSGGSLGFHARLLPMIEKQFGGKLKVVFRHFPIDTACNAHVADGRHPQACQAAYAAEAARDVGGPEAFGKMLDLLLRRQRTFPQGNWAGFAKQLGLDVAAFEQAMASQAVKDRVRADTDLAGRLRLTHAPAVYFNNRFIRAWANPETWQALAKQAAK